MNRKDFQNLALERLKDAQALLKNRRYSGAYYMAGYAVECALKASIAAQTKEFDFPPKDAAKLYTHDLEKLLDSAGLKSELRTARGRSPIFDAYWSAVKDWSEDARYEERSHRQARDMLAAVTDRRHGVLQWLRRHW